MLATRIITAVVLLLSLAALIWQFGDLACWLLTALVVGLAMWEWARLAGIRSHWLSKLLAVMLGMVTALSTSYLMPELKLGLMASAWIEPEWLSMTVIAACLASACWWLIALPAVRRGELPAWLRTPPVLTLYGAYLLVVTALALVVIWQQGRLVLLSVLALVWVADIAAYFGGKSLGGRWFQQRLAPAVSPGKTWEGALTAVLAVQLYGLVCVSQAWPSLPWRLYEQHGWGGVMVVLLLLVVISIVGDLFESLLKRAAGVKDSSGLLPGHGGVLDRIDAQLAVLPFAMLWLMVP